MHEDIILADEVANKRFLGAEFMLWLWYKADQDDALFAVRDQSVEVRFDDQLILEVQLAEAEQSRLKGGAPAHSPEAYKALQHGKRIAKARLRLISGEREWVFVVDAETFAMSGVKIPAVLRSEEDEKLEERLYLIEELDLLWQAIYEEFLTLRLSDAWDKELRAMVDYVAGLQDRA